MAEKLWSVASYARLSGEDGDKAESNSITSQKEMIRDFISKYNNMVIVREYVDKSTPRLIQLYTFKNAVKPPFLGGFFVSRVSAS